MSVFRLPHRDQVEVEAGDNGMVRIRQEFQGEEDSLIFVHASDIDQMIEFLRSAKTEALETLPDGEAAGSSDVSTSVVRP